MNSRFWTFMAAANLFLYLFANINYFNLNDKISKLNMTLFRRLIPNWADGPQVWRNFYKTEYTSAEYEDFLPVGLHAVNCAHGSTLPMCTCLLAAHELGNTDCKEAAIDAMNKCFIHSRPNFAVEELKESLNIYNLASIMNIWGLLGACVIYIRMNVCKEDALMPYFIQFMIGVLVALVHCAVLENSLSSFLIVIVSVVVMSFLTYYHRLDKFWWISMYVIQYVFTLGTLVLLCNMGTQKRDFLYVMSSFLLSVVYGLTTLGRSLFEGYSKQSIEFTGSKHAVLIAMIFMALVLVLSAYDNAGDFLLRTSNAVSFSNTFAGVLLLYLLFGIMISDHVKLISFMDWALRFVISMYLVVELSI